MTKDPKLHTYRSATDVLFAKITSEDLAAALGLATWMIQRTQQTPGTRYFRDPPANWHQGVIDTARGQIERMEKLIEDVRYTQTIERVRVLRPELSAREAQQLLRDTPALLEVVQLPEGGK